MYAWWILRGLNVDRDHWVPKSRHCPNRKYGKITGNILNQEMTCMLYLILLYLWSSFPKVLFHIFCMLNCISLQRCVLFVMYSVCRYLPKKTLFLYVCECPKHRNCLHITVLALSHFMFLFKKTTTLHGVFMIYSCWFVLVLF